MPLTEDQIERHVEKMIDSIDRKYMAGQMTSQEYDEAHAAIARFAEMEYRFSKKEQGR
jgi:hypothetical protein